MSVRTLSIALVLTLGCVGEVNRDEVPEADATSDTETVSDGAIDTGAFDSGSTDAVEPTDTTETSVVDAPPDFGVTDPGTKGDGDFTIGPSYMKAPEMTVAAGVPRGKVYPFTMKSTDSKIYPGVTGAYTRNAWVYVPKQYVNGTMAPFMVVQDGGGYIDRVRAPLDVFINAGELPPIVVIFINPGPGDGRGSERGLEYDTVSAAYTNFIETEVLPVIPKIAALSADYSDLKLTKNPEGRASMGCSSGGAAAFTMGWFRPDLYRRILTYSGTFVNQAPDKTYPGSAWEYHQHLIADTAEKPLRVFLEVGENDLNLDGSFGDKMHNWVTANKAMAKALAAKSYHYRFLFAAGASHCDGRVMDQTLPETLLWLWRGYPIK